MDSNAAISLSQVAQPPVMNLESTSTENPVSTDMIQSNFVISNSTLDLEPNPFERSFARTDKDTGTDPKAVTKVSMPGIPEITVSLSSLGSGPQTGPEPEQISIGHSTTAPTTSNLTPVTVTTTAVGPLGVTNSHHLMKTNSFGIPNIVSNGMTPPILTPGGSKRLPVSSLLPPLPGVLSPGGSIIGTPGIWNTMFPQTPNGVNGGAINNQASIAKPTTEAPTTTLIDGMIQERQQQKQQDFQQGQQQGQQHTNYLNSQQQQQLYNMIMNAKKTGLTPNESMLRTGLTPGGNLMNQFTPLHGFTQQTNGNILNYKPMDENNKDVQSFLPIESGTVTPGLMSILVQNQNENQHENQNENENQDPISQTTQPQIELKPPVQIQIQSQHKQQPQILQEQEKQQIQQKPVLKEEPIKEVKSTTNSKKRAAPPAEAKGPAPKNGRRKRNATPVVKNEVKEPAKKNTTNVTTKRKKGALTEQEKRQHFLERNRLAASKCRERKKQMIEQMRIDLNEQQQENDELRKQIDDLRDYALTLRSVMYAHKDCPSFIDHVGGVSAFNTIFNGSSDKNNEMSVHTIPELLKNSSSKSSKTAKERNYNDDDDGDDDDDDLKEENDSEN